MANGGPVLIARYAPGWIVFAGLRRVIPSISMLIFLLIIVDILHLGEGSPEPHTGDWIVFVIIFFSILFFISGVSLIIRAGSRGFFVANHRGVSVMFPDNGLLTWRCGPQHDIPWSNIAKITPYSMTVNFMPVTRELRIHRRTGGYLAVESLFFDKNPAQMQQALYRYIEEMQLPPDA